GKHRDPELHGRTLGSPLLTHPRGVISNAVSIHRSHHRRPMTYLRRSPIAIPWLNPPELIAGGISRRPALLGRALRQIIRQPRRKLRTTMTKTRLEAFTDGMIAIIITIIVLEIKVPKGADFAALQAGLPIFLAYAL